jgi:hypothetical protein
VRFIKMRLWVSLICMLQLLACRDIRAEREKYHADSIVYTRLLELNSRGIRQLGNYIKSSDIRFQTDLSRNVILDCVDTILYFTRKLVELPFSSGHSAKVDSLYRAFQASLTPLLSDLREPDKADEYAIKYFRKNMENLKSAWSEVEFFSADQVVQSVIFQDWLDRIMNLLAETTTTHCGFAAKAIRILGEAGKDSIWVALTSEIKGWDWSYTIASERPFAKVKKSPWHIEHLQKIAVSDTAAGLFLYHVQNGEAVGLENVTVVK